MTTVTGTIESQRKDGTAIKVAGSWYKGKTDMLRNYNWRQNVELEVNGNFINSIKAVGDAPAASSSGKAPSGGDWDKRQEVIVMQSARNAAIDLFSKLEAAGAVALPTKKEDKYAAAMAFIDEHTIVFHNQAMKVYKGNTVEDAVNADEEA